MREQYEWCNIWWSNAHKRDLPRVLLIGDSIAVGYTDAVTELLKGKANIDRLGTSKGISDPALVKEISYVLGEYAYAAVQFNNGIHGWGISDEEYESALWSLTERLRGFSKGAKIIWASSTPITLGGDPNTLHPKQNASIVRRNAIAAKVMQVQDIQVNDLYGLVVGKADIRASDGAHYTHEGYHLMGKAVADMLEPALK